jgi:thioredoxin-related protein
MKEKNTKKCVIRKIVMTLLVMLAVTVNAQTPLKKVYDETLNPLEQIDQAVAKAKAEDKFVVCQVGGNWCSWCLRFADFATNDTTISKVISDNFEYIHVNYHPRKSGGEAQQQQATALMARLNNCGRFGFPVFVVLDATGKVLHIQDSSFLEEGKGYNKEKVLRFFKNWTPKALGSTTKN